MVIEFIGGFLTNSLALMADAGHMMGDVVALTISLFVTWIITKPASSEKTYGYYRMEVLAALINGLLLAVIAFFIVHEAFQRFDSPPEVKAPLMIVIALGGLVLNVIGIILLHSSSKENLNIKGAFLHLIGDLLGSVGALLAGIIIYIWGICIVDPIISFIIAGLILNSAIKLIMESSNILLEGSPSHVDVNKINNAILNLPEVIRIHDLHVWSISSQRVALSIHIVSDHPIPTTVLHKVDNLLRTDFDIDHLTIQVEPSDFLEQECDF